MNLERLKSWAVVVLPALLLFLLVLGYGALRSIEADLREARHSIEAADRSVRNVTEELHGLRERLDVAQDSIQAIRADIRALNREVGGRVEGLDRRIGDLRAGIDIIDERIAERLSAWWADSLEAPIFIERPED